MTTKPASPLTPDGIARLRLQTLGLVAADGDVDASPGVFDDPVAVVRHLFAMQGQDFAAVQWAIGVRTIGTTRSEVLAAFDHGEIVRSWPMRGTLHAIAPDDLRLLLNLTATRTLKSAATRKRSLDIDDRTTAKARKVAISLLEGSRRASRQELMSAFESAGIATDGQRGYYLIWHLAIEGILCWGPIDGTQQLLVLFDEWAPPSSGSTIDLGDRDACLGELARRYLESHGPATAKDLETWSKLTGTDIKRALAVAGDELVQIDVEGTTYWMSRQQFERTDPAAKASVRSTLLLPGFDEHLLGYRDRSMVLDPAHADQIVPGGNGIFRPTVVEGGVITGTWTRVSTKKKTAITLTALNEAKGFRRSGQLHQAAERYAAFLGTPVTLST